MTPQEVVARARSAIGHGCVYVLGKGGFLPLRATPFLDPMTGCDCSGFAAWCVGVSRHLTGVPHYADFGDWFETTALVRDARSSNGFVDEVPWEQARPGDLLVWGDHDGHQGHVGVVATLDDTGPLTVVHCSRSNYKDGADAIQETSPEVFLKNAALAAHVSWVQNV